MREFLAIGIVSTLLALLVHWWLGPSEPPKTILWRSLTGQDYCLVDTNSSQEFAAQHLPGALSLPLAQAQAGHFPSLPASILVVYAYPKNQAQAMQVALLLQKHDRRPVKMVLDPPLSVPLK
jgi:rhodanese-related sulfurtransferase